MSENNIKHKLKSKTKTKTLIPKMDNKTKTNGKTNEDIEVIDLISEEDPEECADNGLSDDTVVDEELTEEDIDSEDKEDICLEPLNNGPKKTPNLWFKFCGSVKPDLKKPLYGVQFNTYLPEDQNYFATVGANRVTVYKCLSNGSIELIQCFADPNSAEELYTCCWSYEDSTGNPLVITGGKQAIIRVIDCGLRTSRHLIGHGSDINDLKISPYDHNLLLSSSKDYSLRLWNIKTTVCVLKFGGDGGHRDQVICADFYLLSNKYIVSTGMDHSIKIWSLDKQEIKTAISDSYEHLSEGKTFSLCSEHYPVFSTRQIHTNYIDCIQFFGNFLLSKSCHNEIVCSKPTLLSTGSGYSGNGINDEIKVFDRFQLKDSTFWFIKFSMDFNQTLLSVGNNFGVTYVWDMSVDEPSDYEPLVLERPKCKSIVRQTSFSADGSILICVCDDSSIWRWTIGREKE